MIEVEALYTDESRIKAPANGLHVLPNKDVLILIVHTGPQSYRVHGDDFYVFGYKEPDEWFCTGWDEYDESIRVYSQAEPNPGVWSEKHVGKLRRTDYYPEDFIMTYFVGGTVDGAKWNRIVASSEGIMLGRNKRRGD